MPERFRLCPCPSCKLYGLSSCFPFSGFQGVGVFYKDNMSIYCCECKSDVDARPTGGEEIYPHRKDLYHLGFWICDDCKNFVGCHVRGGNPLGCIPTKEIKDARKHIHAKLDPMWKSKKISRKKIYKHISNQLGYEYHTGEIRSVEEARKVYRILTTIILG